MIYWGKIEDRDDPNNMGRYRVRVFGIHSQNVNEIQTKALPWSVTLMPATSPSTNGVGDTPRLQVGNWVAVMFVDEMKQLPVILGTFYSRGEMVEGGSTSNRVIESESGHRVEINDSDSGYIKIQHTSGAIITMDKNGNVNITNTNRVYMDGDLRVDGEVSVGGDVVTDAGISHNNHDHAGDGGLSSGPSTGSPR